MQKSLYHIIWVLILLGINLCAVPISIYSIFAFEKGTNITKMDYTLAITILVISNFITLQLFIAIKKNQKQNAIYGIIIAVTQIIAFILIMHLYEIAGIIIFLLSVIASVIMIIKTWKNKNPALM